MSHSLAQISPPHSWCYPSTLLLRCSRFHLRWSGAAGFCASTADQISETGEWVGVEPVGGVKTANHCMDRDDLYFWCEARQDLHVRRELVVPYAPAIPTARLAAVEAAPSTASAKIHLLEAELKAVRESPSAAAAARASAEKREKQAEAALQRRIVDLEAPLARVQAQLATAAAAATPWRSTTLHCSSSMQSMKCCVALMIDLGKEKRERRRDLKGVEVAVMITEKGTPQPIHGARTTSCGSTVPTCEGRGAGGGEGADRCAHALGWKSNAATSAGALAGEGSRTLSKHELDEARARILPLSRAQQVAQELQRRNQMMLLERHSLRRNCTTKKQWRRRALPVKQHGAKQQQSLPSGIWKQCPRE
ncbi:hypothetical protein JKF63_05804 [Porcisia hertigi]|uniref:Uncharacterized protein n=1 Tax=Porcisia hertigi TaxID=2761500 RepID=A0A836IXQ5_9TRYP|nr:hypothetical protein JKF63_05804 [Porcisia hertigi]